MYTNYPIDAGHRGDSASLIVAAHVDADTDRKLNAHVSATMRILMTGDLIADEIADLIKEPPLYTRPRISELTNLHVLRKSSIKKATAIHGRPANILIPSPDLLDHIERFGAEIEDEDDLKRIVQSFIVSRIIAERAATKLAQDGREAVAMLNS